MSIGLSFTGKIDSPKALLEAASILAEEQKYRLGVERPASRLSCVPWGVS